MAKRVKVGGYLWRDEVRRLIRLVGDEVAVLQRIHNQAKREENKNDLARLLANHAAMLGVLYGLLDYDGRSDNGDVLEQVEELMEEDA